MVFLAYRTALGDYHHLGRETFLAQIEWNDDGWPIVNNTDTLSLNMESDNLLKEQTLTDCFEDTFDSTTLNYQWNFLRNPNKICTHWMRRDAI